MRFASYLRSPELRRVNFLDLEIQFVRSHGSCSLEDPQTFARMDNVRLQGSSEVTFRIYSKPGNAYTYLPHGSSHARGRVAAAELQRATPQSG